MIDRHQHAQETLAIARKNLAAAERQAAIENDKLGSSGKLIPVITPDESGRPITRFVGDIRATFAPWMAPGVRCRIKNPGRGNGA